MSFCKSAVLPVALAFASSASAYGLTLQMLESGFPEGVVIDILGIQIGAPMFEARWALTARYPDDRIQDWPQRFAEIDSVSSEKMILKAVLPNRTGDEKLSFLATIPPSEHRMTIIKREVNFASGHQPEFNALAQSLLEKYGTPSAVTGYGEWVWTYSDSQKRGLPTDVIENVFWSRSCESDPASSGEPNMHNELACARNSGALNQVRVDDLLREARRLPCDAFFYVNLRISFKSPDRVASLTIGAVDYTMGISGAQIDRNTFSEIQELQKQVAPVGAIPDL